MHEGGGFESVAGKASLQRLQIAHHQPSLFNPERARPGMSDIDANGADIAKAFFARPQTEFDILIIAPCVNLRQRADRVETGAGDVEAKTNSIRQVDRGGAVGLQRQRIESRHFFR